jgi:ATP-dependent exoDNAse (exonuclease V) beta subunit
MSELNEFQKRIADTLDGMVVVDAGPGTGKTHTIVERYINLISKPDVSPRDVLLLTFTNNAAAEMDERIKNRMSELGMEKDSKLVQTKTFDAFCLSIVLDSPDMVSEFFGFEDTLTRAATLSENRALNRDYFNRFMDGFLNMKGADYGDIAIIASDNPEDLMDLIDSLMSRGLIPLKKGWFGKNWEEMLEGDRVKIYRSLEEINVVGDKGVSKAAHALTDLAEDDRFEVPEPTPARVLSDDVLREGAYEDRTMLFRFVHDVYYDYIKQCVSDNRLTFGINAMLAYTVLYNNPSVRERNSFRYLMVDEFQDTNANQMMTSLMILKEPNMCVVGDWKQGIYGFRYVSIENITDFERKTVEFRRFLNEDTVRVPFHIPEVKKLSLDINYRSSQLIIDNAYDAIYLPGTKDEKPDKEALDKIVVRISQGREDIGDDTEIRLVQSQSAADEVGDTIATIKDYVLSGKYVVKDAGGSRPLGFGDIAVFCRKTSYCRLIMDACRDAGIPAYLQGDVQIMSTREGKLALAWLRYVNNERDPWAFVPIMADMGYTPIQIRDAVKDPGHKIPRILVNQRAELYRKRRRITDLLTTLFQFYGMDNDITQAIITTMSSIHRGSLLTISDVIRIIEDDIEHEAAYPVENFIDSKAVTIMTMHKSKGLEFPAVICSFIDQGIMPNTKGDATVFLFHQDLGIRCTKVIGRFEGYSKICTNWRTALARKALKPDYSEERRLMFVAMSRAKQYETLISGPKPSSFMKEYNKKYPFVKIEDREYDKDSMAESTMPMPEVPDYPARRTKIGVHEILHFVTDDGTSVSEGSDEFGGKGMEYGTEVHKIAELMCEGKPVDESYPEVENIRKILDKLKDADKLYPEIECGLPIDSKNVTLRGVIDLLALYPDHVEIHDYKTDESFRFEPEYKVQLSIYRYAAERFYGLPVECYIDYVSKGVNKKVEPVSMEEIERRVEEYLSVPKE